MLTYHCATHCNGSSNGLLKVGTRAVFLETFSGGIDKILVVAQATGIIESAGSGISVLQAGKGAAWAERKI